MFIINHFKTKKDKPMYTEFHNNYIVKKKQINAGWINFINVIYTS